jgi:hypothetical protein
MVLAKFSWNDHFSGSPETKLSSAQYNSRQNPSGLSVYVSNCLFYQFTSGSNGGALYCASATSFLIELSSFISCKTSSQYGGAIYFDNSGAQSVLYGVCGNDCCSTYTSGPYEQFAHTRVKNDASSKNNINYSSIVRCVSESTGSSHIIRLFNGKICCPSVNISMNKLQYYSGITCYAFVDTSFATCLISYSSISDNNAFDHLTFYFNTNAKYEMKCCNILRNTHPHRSYGIVSTWGPLMIEDSCILENNASYIFYVGSSSYSITLSNCTVDKTTNNQNLITKNTVTKSYILALNHMSTRNCHSEYDSAGYLTAIPYFSHTTKNLFCCTCKINHCQGRMSVFFSIARLLMFAFIHPNPSGCC